MAGPYGDTAQIKKMLATTGTTYSANDDARLDALNATISLLLEDRLGRRFGEPQLGRQHLLYGSGSARLVLPSPIFRVSEIIVGGTVAAGVQSGGITLAASDWTPAITDTYGQIYALERIDAIWGPGEAVTITGQWADQPLLIESPRYDESFADGIGDWSLVLGSAPQIAANLSEDAVTTYDQSPSLKIAITSSSVNPNVFTNYALSATRWQALPADTLWLHGYLYTDGTSWEGTFGLRCYAANGSDLGGLNLPLPQLPVGAWTEVSGYLTPLASSVTAALTCVLAAQSANRVGTVWCDRLHVGANLQTGIPADIQYIVNHLVVEHFKSENVTIVTEDGIVLPRRDPWADPVVKLVLEKYQISTRELVV